MSTLLKVYFTAEKQLIYI
jgi:hypothetical protein